MPRGAATVTYQIHRWGHGHVHIVSVFFYGLLCRGIALTFLSLSLSHSLCLFQTQTPNFTISLSYTRSLSLYPSRSISVSHTRTHTHLLFSLPLSLREGLSPPLAYTPLSEAWSDHLFYFSTLSFKKSGNYTVSFLLEVNLFVPYSMLRFVVCTTLHSVVCATDIHPCCCYIFSYIALYGLALTLQCLLK